MQAAELATAKEAVSSCNDRLSQVEAAADHRQKASPSLRAMLHCKCLSYTDDGPPGAHLTHDSGVSPPGEDRGSYVFCWHAGA